jgi:hypothetical protein
MLRENANKRTSRNRKLVELRLLAGLTPNGLALRAQVSGNVVRNAEAGRYIEVPQQKAIADVLEQSVLELFPLERQRQPGTRRAAS